MISCLGRRKLAQDVVQQYQGEAGHLSTQAIVQVRGWFRVLEESSHVGERPVTATRIVLTWFDASRLWTVVINTSVKHLKWLL